jgi:hypothetical protein
VAGDGVPGQERILLNVACGLRPGGLVVGRRSVKVRAPWRAARGRELPHAFAEDPVAKALGREAELGYTTPSGRYWEELHRFDAEEIDRLDALWLATVAA